MPISIKHLLLNKHQRKDANYSLGMDPGTRMQISETSITFSILMKLINFLWVFSCLFSFSYLSVAYWKMVIFHICLHSRHIGFVHMPLFRVKLAFFKAFHTWQNYTFWHNSIIKHSLCRGSKGVTQMLLKNIKIRAYLWRLKLHESSLPVRVGEWKMPLSKFHPTVIQSFHIFHFQG